jgi:hypothetical protein
MGLSPFDAGDGKTWPNQGFLTDSGGFSLSGVANGAIAMHILDINNNNALYICTGTWNITNVGLVGPPIIAALANFTPSAQDLLSTNPLGKPGLYKVYPVVTLSTGPVAMDPQLIQVVALP